MTAGGGGVPSSKKPALTWTPADQTPPQPKLQRRRLELSLRRPVSRLLASGVKREGGGFGQTDGTMKGQGLANSVQKRALASVGK